jgi:hypothetical protein
MRSRDLTSPIRLVTVIAATGMTRKFRVFVSTEIPGERRAILKLSGNFLFADDMASGTDLGSRSRRDRSEHARNGVSRVEPRRVLSFFVRSKQPTTEIGRLSCRIDIAIEDSYIQYDEDKRRRS